ncbi:NAD(P)/FAD-dependent oxidoreductase [Streptomyces sp. NPDC048297]|uniref:NAD(P)/FAD-dependent oxidoreductase n=1 Tax=Streptomyces sp. NPDC048297 TaxID=3365531 RepID=UPI00371F0A52
MTAQPPPRRVDVLVVGAGPAGLATAARIAAAGAGRVEVLERETQAGGVPRHCAHGGFGTWTHPLTGPGYARLLTEAATRAGAVPRTGVTVLDWAGPRTLTTVGPQGPETIEARAVVLATGSRERPRAARLVPGTRPAGVYTTGELQQAVHLFGQSIGTRAVVVGAESVSYAAAGTVRAAGAEVVALVTDHPSAQADQLRVRVDQLRVRVDQLRVRADQFRVRAARLRHRVPLLTDTTVTELLGHGRLSGVRVRHRDGRTATLACDTVVFTGDFVAADELARQSAITLGTGPDTSRPGVFATGALLHPGQRARAARRAGTEAAGAVLKWLEAGE